MPGQSRKMSFIESVANVTIGYAIAVGSQYIIFPIFGVHIPLREHMIMGGLFTIVSVIRSYYVRRLFNLLYIKTVSRKAKRKFKRTNESTS